MTGTTNTDTFDIEEQIEEAKASLDRINGWINSCDSKAGTVLALIGVLLTIIFTNDGMAEMYNVLQYIIPPTNFCTYIYYISWNFCIHVVLWNYAVDFNFSCKN